MLIEGSGIFRINGHARSLGCDETDDVKNQARD